MIYTYEELARHKNVSIESLEFRPPFPYELIKLTGHFQTRVKFIQTLAQDYKVVLVMRGNGVNAYKAPVDAPSIQAFHNLARSFIEQFADALVKNAGLYMQFINDNFTDADDALFAQLQRVEAARQRALNAARLIEEVQENLVSNVDKADNALKTVLNALAREHVVQDAVIDVLERLHDSICGRWWKTREFMERALAHHSKPTEENANAEVHKILRKVLRADDESIEAIDSLYSCSVEFDLLSIRMLVMALGLENRIESRASDLLCRHPNDMVVTELQRAIKAFPQSMLRERAGMALARLQRGRDFWTEIIADEDEDDKMRSIAIAALGLIGDASDVPTIVSALNGESSTRVKRSVVGALGRIKSDASIDALKQMARDQALDFLTRQLARHSLQAYGVKWWE